MYEISDDDESFSGLGGSKMAKNGETDTISISSDEEPAADQPSNISEQSAYLSSDSDELPEVEVVQKTLAIKNLFSPKKEDCTEVKKKSATKVLFPPSNQTSEVNIAAPPPEKIKIKHESFRVLGIEVIMPVKPYSCQLNLMHKIIKGIKESENCILESPTGSGKTLALLCGVLSWQQSELNRIAQEQAQAHAQAYFKDYPQLQRADVTDYIASPTSKKTDVTPELLFSKNSFGEKSIYQNPEGRPGPSDSTKKRAGPYTDETNGDASTGSLVSLHKKRRQGSVEPGDLPSSNPAVTPEKPIQSGQKGTPEDVRKLYDLVDNLRFRTSMTVDCSKAVPTIYYGARTHTQLQQVIKEFRRSHYCGLVKMSVLSSRGKSCIREFNRDQWKSKDDMCRACVKSTSSNGDRKKDKDTNCKYFDNRASLNHGSMPPAFDLEDLVRLAEEKEACPYYAARAMAQVAHIVFCPYNYLIDPSIRSSLRINLENNIVVIDEAHNIESICRDAASFSLTQNHVRDALKELEKVAEYRYASQEGTYIDDLIRTLKSWNDWFTHQVPLMNTTNSNNRVYEWASPSFVQTLANHNIGYSQFNSFKSNAEVFCSRLREDPRTLLGVTQATGTLLETLSFGLDYLFREECRHLDDYKPALAYDTKDALCLTLHCLNPALVMRGVLAARSVLLASGTLTPLGSIEAELGARFPHVATPSHVIPHDRVWIGTVWGENNTAQKYAASDIKEASAAARLGRLLSRVCRLTPHGVLCFLPSYSALYTLRDSWQCTGVWQELKQLKHVFVEQRKDGHDEMMKDFYECVEMPKGALLFAVYRGKVSEGMDFKDHQARAVVCVGIPYLSRFDAAVRAKLDYNDKNTSQGLLSGDKWMQVQAYRALNQAVGRSIRHKADWGAVLLVDSRYSSPANTAHLSGWVRKFLGNNHHSYESLESSADGLAQFMHKMSVSE